MAEKKEHNAYSEDWLNQAQKELRQRPVNDLIWETWKAFYQAVVHSSGH